MEEAVNQALQGVVMSLVMSMVGGMVRQVNVTKVLDITGLAAGLEDRVEKTGDEVEREGVRVNHTSTTKRPTHQLPRGCSVILFWKTV